jgi:hypothetical protein
MTSSNFKGLRNTLLGLLALWFAAVLLIAYNRVYDSHGPIYVGLSAAVPILVFAIWFYSSAVFRQYVLSLNPTILTAVHTWRIEGIVFVILCLMGFLPASFAYPAGFGDMAIGITAPLIAYAWSKKKLSPGVFILWQSLGIADLVVAVTTGVLNSQSNIGILAHGTTTRIMGLLPMSLIPTFAVPLMLILHIICIAQTQKLTREPAGLSGSPSLNLG